jgi:hypothetical protein
MGQNWTRPFKTIALTNGGEIASLGEARDFIASLSLAARTGSHWKYAEDLLLRAIDRNEKYSTMDLRAQMMRALKTDGFLSSDVKNRPTPASD